MRRGMEMKSGQQKTPREAMSEVPVLFVFREEGKGTSKDWAISVWGK